MSDTEQPGRFRPPRRIDRPIDVPEHLRGRSWSRRIEFWRVLITLLVYNGPLHFDVVISFHWLRKHRPVLTMPVPAQLRGTSWRRQIDLGGRVLTTLLVDNWPLHYDVLIAFVWLRQQRPILLDDPDAP
jgi:hypothetical protein